MQQSQYKRVYFKSGFSASIQAAERSYCTPRNNTGPYTAVEIGFPDGIEPMIIGYAEDPENPEETVYGYVPAGIVKALFVKHGEPVEGECPPLDMNAEQSAIMAEAMLKI